MAMEGIEIEVYDFETPTVRKTVLNGRVSPQFLDELGAGAVGGGSFMIPMNDPKILQDPSLIQSRNVIKMRVDGVVVGGFIITGRKSTTIGSGETAEAVYEISGEGFKSWFDDAEVRPFGDLRPTSNDTRNFSFASERGVWYNDADWKSPQSVGQVHKLPIYGENPDKWPEKSTAQWIWGTAFPVSAAPGFNYFRYEFTTSVDDESFVIYAAGDDSLTVYVDGEEVAVSTPDGVAYTEATRIELKLSSGSHVIAAVVENYVVTTANPGGLLMSIYKVDQNQKEILFGQTGQGIGWKVLAYPETVPGWSAAAVLVKLMDEAKARGVLFPTWMSRTFSNTVDSNGNPWQDSLPWLFGVGESLASVIQKMEEVVLNIWIDPEDYQVRAAPVRGRDLSFTTGPDQVAVVFEKGKNLLQNSTESRGKIKNALSLKSNAGWLKSPAKDTASISKYGVIEGTLDTGASKEISNVLAKAVFVLRASEEEGASYNVYPTTQTPFVHFKVGDWVLAPNERGLLVKRRVMSISTQEADSGRPVYAIEFDVIFRENEDRLNRAISKLGAGGVGGSFSNAAGGNGSFGGPITVPTAPVIKTPKAPTNLTATSEGDWTANGVTPFSEVTLNWTAVTTNTDGSETIPDLYEVWAHLKSAPDTGWAQYADTSLTEAIIRPFVPGTEWTFKVLARNKDRVSSFSAGKDHVMVGPTEPLPAPDIPALKSDLGLLMITWTGKLMGNDPKPHFRYVFAEVAEDLPTLVWKHMGGAVTRDGRQIVVTDLIVGKTYKVRLRAVDGIGIMSPTSAVATITLTGVDLGPLEEQLEENAEAVEEALELVNGKITDVAAQAAAAKAESAEALASANGKTSIYFKATPATGTAGYKEGDIWFQRVAENIVGQWEFTAGAWARRDLTDAVIANLDAAKIITGYLNSDRIDANSISTNKLLVGNFSNLLEDPSFEANNPLIAWTAGTVPANTSRTTANPRTGDKSFRVKASTAAFEATRQVAAIGVEAGEEYVFGGWVKFAVGSSSEDGAIELSIAYGTTAATTTTTVALDESPPLTNSFQFFSGGWVVPAGIKFARPRIVVRKDNGDTNVYQLDDMTFYKRVEGSLVVDGSITAIQLGAESVVAGKIAAQAIATENLQAESITAEILGAGAVTARSILTRTITADHIKVGAIQTNNLSPAVGKELNLTSNGSVTIIAGQIADVQEGLNGTSDSLEDMQTYYKFGSSGAVISMPSSPFALALRNDSIEMLENGNVVSYWNSGTMYVTSFVGEEVILGNHKLEKYSTGTVVRAL